MLRIKAAKDIEQQTGTGLQLMATVFATWHILQDQACNTGDAAETATTELSMVDGCA